MQVCVIGAGYVGVATAVSLSRLGHRVTAVERDAARAAALAEGRLPFDEPELAAALRAESAAGRLHFTSGGPINEAEVALICVGTPGDEAGRLDTAQVAAAAQELRDALPPGAVVAIKSTVPPGTAARLRAQGPAIVSNPEFLREGRALRDALEPSRIVIGAFEAWAGDRVERLYAGLAAPVVRTTPTAAELIKVASNAFLAAKIAVANELADWSRAMGVPWSAVAPGVGLDPRIGPDGLAAGLGFGGSCLPKDVAAVAAGIQEAGLSAEILSAVRRANASRVGGAVAALGRALGGLSGKRLAVWGLSFKPGTGDVRGSQALRTVEALVDAGATVRAYDPRAAAGEPPPGFDLAADPYAALAGAAGLAILTPWPQFTAADWGRVRAAMEGHAVFDPWECANAAALATAGLCQVM